MTKLNKTITTTTVNGFVLDENNMPTPVTVALDGKVAESRAHSLARKAYANILISGVSYTKERFELDKEIALENATTEKQNSDDITLGETGTVVYYIRLAERKDGAEYPHTETGCIALDSPMTETRAFGAARRALAFDILPYASEQVREKSFISRAKFFELATKISDENANDFETETEDEDA